MTPADPLRIPRLLAKHPSLAADAALALLAVVLFSPPPGCDVDARPCLSDRTFQSVQAVGATHGDFRATPEVVNPATHRAARGTYAERERFKFVRTLG